MSELLPRENVYTCQKCGRYTVTVDVDEGVTPFMIQCRAQDGPPRRCTGMAHSNFYPKGPRPKHIGPPQWEFYKPTDAELRVKYKGDLLEQMREHVSKGGLDLRRRTKKTPVMHAAPSPREEK